MSHGFLDNPHMASCKHSGSNYLTYLSDGTLEVTSIFICLPGRQFSKLVEKEKSFLVELQRNLP